MKLNKRHIGYHDKDGGNVYKVDPSNSLLSYFYCDFCKSSSSSNNLGMAEVFTDLSSIDSQEMPGGLSGTDNDYKQAYDLVTDAYYDVWAAGSDKLTIPTPLAPFKRAHEVLDFFSLVKTTADSVKTNIQEKVLLDSSAATFNQHATQFYPEGSTFGGYSHWYRFRDGTDALTSHYGIEEMPQIYSDIGGFIQSDGSVNGFFETPSFTSPSGPFLDCLVSVYMYAEDDTNLYRPWTGGSFVLMEISNNNGSTWKSAKYANNPAQWPDGTAGFLAEDNWLQTWVHFDDAGTGVLKTRCTFFAGGAPASIATMTLDWQWDGSSDPYTEQIIEEERNNPI
jgi:hypothetical protein